MRFEPYRDRLGRWRWRAVASNGRKVAASGEAFASRFNAERAINQFRHAVVVAAFDEAMTELVDEDQSAPHGESLEEELARLDEGVPT